MRTVLTHPSREELFAYSLGQLSEDQAIKIDGHISECEPCCETIIELSAEDTFACLLHEVGEKATVQTAAQTATDSDPATDIPAPLLEHPRYEVNRLVGKGGMGDVYEARHRKMNRPVAVKVINRDLFRKRAVMDRFHREVQAAAKLSHPNIVASYDADQAGDFHFLVMEYVDGFDLSQTIRNGKKLAVSQAIEYVRQAAIGLQHAHEMGMVHRDVKPHNLMVTVDGTVKILDFGLASLASETIADVDTVEANGDLTVAGSIMGTPDFISPEQAKNARNADIRSDIYSLGATLYYLIAGRPPFNDGSVVQKLQQHADAAPDPLETLRDDIPSDLIAIVSKMMAKDPGDRFQTPLDVAQALEGLAEQAQTTKSIEAQPHTKPHRQAPRVLPLIAVATVLLAAIFAAVVFYLQTNNGTVRVKVLDESLAVKVSGQTIKMNDGDKEITIGAGEQRQLVVSQDGSDFELVTEKFLIRRNDKIVFEVDFVEGDLVVLKDGEQFDHMKTMPPLIEPQEKPQQAVAERATDAEVAKAKEILGFTGDVTPEAIIAALDAGLFAYPLDKTKPESKQPSRWGGPIRLRTAVRGEGDQGVLNSPVLDLLSVVAKPQGAVTEESILKLDKKLVELSDQRGLGIGHLEAGVAATVFAFQRGDVGSAMKRVGDLKFYGNYFRSKGGSPFDLNLWLAVRNALNLQPTDVPAESHRQQPEETIAVARDLDEYAVRAARKSDDPRVEQALLRERAKLLQFDRLELAKAAFARGDREEAKEILRTVPGVGSAGPFILYDMPKFDSDAAVAFKLAELLEEQSDWTNAADAYLEAYCGEIRLLEESQVPTFKKCGRTTELVKTLVEQHVVRLDAGYLPITIVELLLKDENTRADGDQLLKHLWASPESILIGRLLRQKEIWKHVPDLSYYLRKVLLPSNIASGGAGWVRFNEDFPSKLELLLSDKDVLRKLAKEVEAATAKYPQWKAGPAVLAFLEAEVGNPGKATELIRQVLADAESRPITSDSAFSFGLALEGKGEVLDRELMRLYESSLRNRPIREMRRSAIPDLARLRAKYDEQETARQVLHRLAYVDYDPLGLEVRCSPANHVGLNRCNACHRGKSNLKDVVLMADKLTDVGFPTDALLSLARIDESFQNVYSSDDVWFEKFSPKDISWDIYSIKSFGRAKTKAENAITPQAVLNALKSGAFSDRDMTKPAPENAELAIDLMTSVRGVDGKSVLFSPAVEVLELAAKAKGDNAAIANVQIDQLLSEAFDKNPDNLEVGIAATVFAFLRKDLDAARKRLPTLNGIVAGTDVQKSDVALWLVARLALTNKSTSALGRQLTKRALTATEQRDDELWKQALVEELSASGILQLMAPPRQGIVEGKAAFNRGQNLERQGKWEEATDAFLEAYRLDPSLLAYDQFETIKKAKRTREFVEVFTIERLKQVEFAYQPSVQIVRDLLNDEATCLDGNVFLKNMWKAKPDESTLLIGYRENEIWPNVTDTTFLIRDRVLPADIPSEGAGWDRFTIDSIGARGGTGSGIPENLRPLFKNTPQQNESLRKLAREVEAKTRQFPGWKAGLAILGFLEAKVGNEKRAVELFEEVLTDSADPMPSKSAWVFGSALEGTSVALDQIVMRLYERNLTGNYSPSSALNVSSIASLARLYAKYDRRDEARHLLLRLSEPQGPGTDDKESQFVSCSDGFVLQRETEAGWIVLAEDQVPQSNCMACHRKERNLENYLLMANGLTDIGYPVEARLTLGRIGASFYNALGSDEDWARSNTSILRWSYFGKEAFQPARAKAERAITPQALLEALKSGVSINNGRKNPVISESASRIDLITSVRGVDGKSVLFSPALEVLELAAKAKGDEAAIVNVQIDQLLSAAFDKNPGNVEVGIAATVFAFLRNDLDSASKRLQKLQAITVYPESDGVAFWLVARHALQYEQTRIIGAVLADRALTAADKKPDSGMKKAIVRERSGIRTK